MPRRHRAPRPAAPAGPGRAPPGGAGSPPALPPAPGPFQAGLKYAYIRLDVIAAASSEGRVASEKVKALNDQKVRELNDRNKALQAAQQKLEQGGAVLNEAARGQLQPRSSGSSVIIQRFTEDAQQDVQALQQQLQADFQRKLDPSIDRVAKEKQVHMVFSVPTAAWSGRIRHGPDRRHHPRLRRDRRQTRRRRPPLRAPAPAPAAAAPARLPHRPAPGAK